MREGEGGRVREDMFCVDLLNALITVVSFTVSLPWQLNDTDPERRDELTEREEREGPLKPTGDCLIVTGTLPTSHVILVRGCELTVHVNVSISGINGLTGSVNDWLMNISCISVINNNFNNFNSFNLHLTSRYVDDVIPLKEATPTPLTTPPTATH